MNILETLTHGCLACGQAFKETDRVTSVYKKADVGSFEFQVELGIVGNGVRNYWMHLYCHEPRLEGHELKPDIHHCVECREALDKNDMIVPIFQIDDARAVNPLDPTDVGLALTERLYFVHGNCRNKTLSKHSSNILHIG